MLLPNPAVRPVDRHNEYFSMIFFAFSAAINPTAATVLLGNGVCPKKMMRHHEPFEAILTFLLFGQRCF
jgi:hypothetical protein